jgi:hypothetical protein
MVLEESQLYRDLMRLKPDGWTANAWAVRAGVSRTVWTDMRRHGNPSRRTLEKLLAAAGSSLAEFEALRIGEAPPLTPGKPLSAVTDRFGSWPAGSPAPLPLIASAKGGIWQSAGAPIELTEIRTGAILDRLPRPPSLAGDAGAYAFATVGDAMWPRFRSGRRTVISPKEAIVPGDDVLVTLARKADGTASIFVAELVARLDGTMDLRQFNPDRTFSIATDQVEAVHKVVGELI